MRKCCKCNKTKSDDNFFRVQSGVRKGKWQSYCKSCNNQNTLDRQRAFKEKTVEYKGGCCERCGYNKCNAALEFHHLDPSKKDNVLSRWKLTSFEKNYEEIINELDKCILVCANCHRELHVEKCINMQRSV